jgi:hypothetical protein
MKEKEHGSTWINLFKKIDWRTSCRQITHCDTSYIKHNHMQNYCTYVIKV